MSRILVVDDDRYMAEAAAIMLVCESEHEVVTAFSGYSAMAELRNKDFALVITDLKMPGMDGFALLESMRQSGMQIPAIMITSFHTPEEEKRARKLNVYAYLTKPFDNDELKALVHKALEH
ncbi:response regulator [Candidatus Poribacteria bacterium]